jgi:hypothetical protein
MDYSTFVELMEVFGMFTASLVKGPYQINTPDNPSKMKGFILYSTLIFS